MLRWIRALLAEAQISVFKPSASKNVEVKYTVEV